MTEVDVLHARPRTVIFGMTGKRSDEVLDQIDRDLGSECGRVMVGRVHMTATRTPAAEVAMGELDCRLSSSPDGWLNIVIQSATPFSHVNMALMNEGAAVVCRSAGRSAMEISDVRVS
jgi:hypothetical protein